jgi:hypothetical protein
VLPRAIEYGFWCLVTIPSIIVKYSVWDKSLVALHTLNQIVYVIYLTRFVGVLDKRGLVGFKYGRIFA